jgi:hypothetical protein
MNSHRTSTWQRLIVLPVVLTWVETAYGQQAKQPSRSELQAEIAMLRTALADCQNAKQTAKMATEQTAISKSAREDAIASLRAVKSALSTGANIEDFKKYQIESRIKIDALPNAPENGNIRGISDLYREAISFSIMSTTGGNISSVELAAAKDEHRDNEAIFAALGHLIPADAVGQYAETMAKRRVSNEGLKPPMSVVKMAEYTQAFREQAPRSNAEYAKDISRFLIREADEKLSTLK